MGVRPTSKLGLMQEGGDMAGPNIAEEAVSLVTGDRNAQYGPPIQDYERTAAVWSGLLVGVLGEGQVITPKMAILMMAALKICREVHAPKRDNRVDAIGYMLCSDWVETGVKPVPCTNHQELKQSSAKTSPLASGSESPNTALPLSAIPCRWPNG